ncbi:PspC domain-containing protein [Saccharopolyspora sp. K220]|uniref:PspC domain-containing protein n=1 Tax=Saccharopolyspora soli TaxID=2926618 RepID=UPI001F59388B|nr:PspC domain-containing protein [Saccharopolyspora soli]MCI2419423.1 PspC domain-containing protein [Saccharopolyspora soli]
MSSTKRSGFAGIEDTLRDFWATRPVRPRNGGKLGGVSAAIGLRYGVDPILVRVAFVLATVYGGAGLVLYLLGWLLFPREGDPVPGSTEPIRQPTSTRAAVVLVLLLIPGVFWLTTSPAIIGLAVGLGALYMLHRNYGEKGMALATAAPSTTRPVATPVGENTWVYPGGTSTDAPVGESSQQAPPTWDPLGAAPFAWDLPEPDEPEDAQPRRPRRRWISFVALAVAAFFAGLATTLGASLGTALAIALGVLGLGMVVGAFLRGGRGLIWAAVPVGALAMVLGASTGFSGDVGDVEIRPTSIENVAPRYQKSAGSIMLDLQDLRMADGQELRTGANVGIGDITVHAPPEADLQVRCLSELGSVNCLDVSADGSSVERSVVDNGADGPGGGRIVLDLVVGTGDVEVVRG